MIGKGKSIRRAIAVTAVLSAGLLPLSAMAAPMLEVHAEQRRQPARLSLSPLPMWDTEWWLLVEATPDDAALTRLEYRLRFLDDRPQSQSGGIALNQSDPAPMGGRVAIQLPTRDDYDRRFEVRARVTDAAGGASPWRVIEFPPEKTILPPQPDAYSVSAQTDPERKQRVIGTVEYEADETTRLREVRDELGRQARAAGADAAVAMRLVRSGADSFVFAADAVRYLEVAKPTPTPVALTTDRKLGEIVVSYERR